MGTRASSTAALLALVGGLCFAGSADKDGNYVDPINTLAPGKVDTVTVGLTWTAPAANNFYDATYYYGAADSYELRYSTTSISGGYVFTALIPAVADLPAPGQPYNYDTGEPAEIQSVTVRNLDPKTDYWFVMKVVFRGSWDYSNVVHVTTISDIVAPASITTLAAEPLGWESVKLAWSATGDDNGAGTAARYDLRYSKDGPITTNEAFTAAKSFGGLPDPLAAGGGQSCVVAGLAPTTTYWFAIRAFDEVNNPGALAATSPVATTSEAPPPGDGGGDGACGGSAAGSAPLTAAAIAIVLLLLRT